MYIIQPFDYTEDVIKRLWGQGVSIYTTLLFLFFFKYSVTPSDVEHQKEHKTSVYLKAAGNLATRTAVHYLEQFIKPESHQPEYRRLAALWALKGAASRHPELVGPKHLLPN